MRPLVLLLLRLYSAPFRRKFGAEAVETLIRDMDASRGLRGRGGLRRLVLVGEFALEGLLDRAQAVRRALALDEGGLWSGWGQDIRLALRSSSRRLGFTLVAVMSLAIGVGANSVVFSVVDTFLMRDIPGAGEPDRMVEMHVTLRNGRTSGWDYPDFRDVAEDVDGLESAAMFERGPVSLSDDGQGSRLLALYVTSGYFPTVGVSLLRGPGFTADVDAGAGEHAVAVLSYETWQERFQGDPDIVGRSIRLNRAPYTVVGVAPEGYRGHQFGLQPAVYLPLTQYPPAVHDPERYFGSRGTLWAGVVGRMAPGWELDPLNESLRTVMARLEEAYPDSNEGVTAQALPAGLFPAEARAIAAMAFALLGALMLLVLAAASANVGGMLLARASSRQREMAIRMALGSGRARVVRHLVTEAMVVFVLGGAAGVFVAYQGVTWFEKASALPTFLPVRLEFALDGRMMAFGMALTLCVGLAFALLPALGASRDHITVGLREGAEGARTSRLRRVFVAGQVGVSVLLLAAAALFLRSLHAGGDVDMGFTPEGVYLTGFDLALEGYDDPDEATVFIHRLLDQVRGLPDVAGATVASDFPLDGGSSSIPVWPDGKGEESDGWFQAYYARVSNGYFETLGIPLVTGRTFGADDGRTTRPVAVINRFLADAAWPGEDPIGRTVEFGLVPRLYEVIGVVGDTQSDLITDRPAGQVFTLVDQDPDTDLFLAVRQRGAAPNFPARVRREVLAVDPALALSSTRSLAGLAGLGMLPQRLVASIAGILGTLALFLSALGVYGVVAFMVTRRTREIGIRMALGSSRTGVMRRVLLDGLRLALPGLGVGLPLALALTTALRGLLVGVSPLDPLAYAAVTGVFLVVIAAASLAPARRASSIEPATALRSD